VRVNSQLKSHKRFAGNFRKYCDLVDNARLYSTNTINGAKVRLSSSSAMIIRLGDDREIYLCS
jgi:hypothetical protein